MKLSQFLLVTAFCLGAGSVLAGDSLPQTPEDAESTVDVLSAIRTEVIVSDRIASEFESLAGSHKNAQNLVAGLRNAKPVKMTARVPAPQVVSFTPPTRPMSFSDIHQALVLAQAHLQSKHIDNPTPAQLKAALAGGELPNADGNMTHVVGILPLYRRGMDWNQIAHALRVSHLIAPKRMAAAQPARTAAV